jgi:hypothetical protein
MIRGLLALICCTFLVAHLTIGLTPFIQMFDLDVGLTQAPYLLAIPGMALFTFYMLRD